MTEKRIRECVQRMIELAYAGSPSLTHGELTCGDLRAIIVAEYDVSTVKAALAWIKRVAEADYDA
jgi:hypothetical protein